MKLFKSIAGFCLTIVILLLAFQFVLNPKYSYPSGQIFSGTNLYNPYLGIDTCNWKKANFHLHTRAFLGLTDGDANSNHDADNYYKYFNYDIHCTSDYMKINKSLVKDKLYIPVYEHGYQYYKTHQLVINAKKVIWADFFFRQTCDNKQYIINRLKEDSSTLVALVHPTIRNAYKATDFELLGNYDCLEITNSRWLFVKYYDFILSSGKPVFLMANDDAHNLSEFSDAAHSFNVINTDLNTSSVINAIKAGKSYGVRLNLKHSNCNSEKKSVIQSLPVLTGFEVNKDTIIVKINKMADTIKFIGQYGIIKSISANTKNGIYVLSDDDTYIRTEIVCKDGSFLYLNPVFRYDDSRLPFVKPVKNVVKTRIYRSAFSVLSLLLILAWVKLR